jgi:integrase
MAAALRLLLVLGLRTGELRLTKWESIDFKARTLTVPVALQKLTLGQQDSAEDFVVPLPPLAIELFEELQDLADDRPWVLPSMTARVGVYDDKSLGRYMRRLWKGERASHGRSAAKAHPALVGFKAASPHDLRRTCRTWLGKLGIAPHIAERVLNHKLGRIVETYDRGDYLEERREALGKWAAEIERITRIS